MRQKETYKDDLKTNNVSLTSYKESCSFNDLHAFHVYMGKNFTDLWNSNLK